MGDMYSPLFLIPIIIGYYFWILVLPILVAQLLVYMLTKHFGWKLKKKYKWLWIILLASIWITYPWFSIVEDIEGRVIDVTGQPIEGVLVTALWEHQPMIPIPVTSIFAPAYGRSLGVGGAREAVTDKEGRFRVPGFTYIPSFNQKLRLLEPEVRFYHEGLRVDYRLSKFLGTTYPPNFDWGIIRKSMWNGLDVVMVLSDNGSLQNGYSGSLWGFVSDVLSEDNDNCMWTNIPNAIVTRLKAAKNSIWISEDTVKFGRRSLPRNMEKCGVDISFFEGLDVWNIKIVQ